MMSRINKGSVAPQAISDEVAVQQSEANEIVTDNKDPDKLRSSKMSSVSIALDAKGMMDMEANLRRFGIEKDLDQPDMAAAKTYQNLDDQA